MNISSVLDIIHHLNLLTSTASKLQKFESIVKRLPYTTHAFYQLCISTLSSYQFLHRCINFKIDMLEKNEFSFCYYYFAETRGMRRTPEYRNILVLWGWLWRTYRI